jgi:hypothetical protein
MMNTMNKEYALLEIEVVTISEDVITGSGFYGEDVDLPTTNNTNWDGNTANV